MSSKQAIEVNESFRPSESFTEITKRTYSVEPGIIKDEHGNIPSESKPKPIFEQAKEQIMAVAQSLFGRMPETRIENSKKELLDQTKDQTVGIDTKSAAKDLIHTETKKAETTETEVTLEQAHSVDQIKMAEETEAVEEPKSILQKVTEKVEPYLDQAKEQATQVAAKAKDVYEENVPKALGGTKERPKPLLRQAKIAYRETMPEILGGRPSSIPEVVGAVVTREVDAHKQKEEAKEFEQLPPEDQSILDKAKHDYREKMPAILGGRPATVTELGEKLVHPVVDNMKKSAQEEVENLKSSYEEGTLGEHVKEKTKEVYKNNMPESLGGRPPTFVEKAKKQVVHAVVKNRVNALIAGTKEQIANKMEQGER